MSKTPQSFNVRMHRIIVNSWICYQQPTNIASTTKLIPLTINNSILTQEQSKSPLSSHSTALPKHLDRYLDEPFDCQKSIELDRWLWYIQCEFEGVE